MYQMNETSISIASICRPIYWWRKEGHLHELIQQNLHMKHIDRVIPIEKENNETHVPNHRHAKQKFRFELGSFKKISIDWNQLTWEKQKQISF